MLLSKDITAGFFCIENATDSDIETFLTKLKKYDFEVYKIQDGPYFVTGRKVWVLCNAKLDLVENAMKDLTTRLAIAKYELKDYASATARAIW